MEEAGELLKFIKNVLQSRAFPITYSSLRELILDSPVQHKVQNDVIVSQENFLNYLLTHPSDFSIAPDGSVNLVGGTQYVFPQPSVDTSHTIAASDDSYFGDREEYISDSDDESNDSDSAKNQLLKEDIPQSEYFGNQCSYEKAVVVVSEGRQDSNCSMERQKSDYDTSSTSESSNLYLSSDSNINSSLTSDSNSSFESCDENEINEFCADVICSCTSSSPSFSSCSDS